MSGLKAVSWSFEALRVVCFDDIASGGQVLVPAFVNHVGIDASSNTQGTTKFVLKAKIVNVSLVSRLAILSMAVLIGPNPFLWL